MDGILKARLGQHSAYQVKFHTNRPSLIWRKIANATARSEYQELLLLQTEGGKQVTRDTEFYNLDSFSQRLFENGVLPFLLVVVLILEIPGISEDDDEDDENEPEAVMDVASGALTPGAAAGHALVKALLMGRLLPPRRWGRCGR